MDLQRRLRREHGARPAGDMNRLPQRIARENAGARAHDDDVCRRVELEGAADTKRRLGVRVRHNGTAVAALEDKLESRVTADDGWRTVIW